MATAAAPTDLERTTRLFGALSDETRLHILNLLRGSECCVCELTEAVGIGQSLLSFHLRTLKQAGLVADRRDGRWVHYSLNTRGLEQIGEFVAALVSPAPSSGCCLPGATGAHAVAK